MLLKAVICDDSQNDAEHIRELLTQYEMQYDIDFEISVFLSPTELLNTCKVGDYQLAFFDVEMPGINGLALAEKLRSRGDNGLNIIFVSNYPRYMQDSFPVHPVYYLIKPLTYAEFSRVLGRLLSELEASHTCKTLLTTDGNEVFVDIRDIVYIEALKGKKDTMLFHLANEDIEVNGILKDWETILAEHKFFSPYRGILINLIYIHYIQGNQIRLSTGTDIPLSRRKSKELHTLLSRRLVDFS